MDLPFGKYIAKETKAPANYNMDSTPWEINFVASEEEVTTLDYTFENTEIKGVISILKRGESLTSYTDGQFVYTEQSLQGAEFELRKKDSDVVLGTYTTDENGQIQVNNLPLGIYTLTETKAPYGMTLDTTPVEIEAKQVAEGTIIEVKTIMNNRQKIVMDITKQDKSSKAKLSGGQFDLYAEEDIKNYKGEVIVSKDALIESVEAKNGKVAFTKDIPHAKYYVKESKAINGYKDNATVYHIDSPYQDQTLKTMGVTLVIDNEKKPDTPPSTPPETPPTTSETPPTMDRADIRC